MDIFENIKLPSLPPLSLINSNECTTGGAIYKDPDDEIVHLEFIPPSISRIPIIVKQEEHQSSEESKDKSEEDPISDDDSSDDEGFESFEDYDSYKQRKILKTGRKIQKMLSKNYLHNKKITMEWQRNLRSLLVEFVKMYLNDYHTDMYHHITAILLDCKAMAKQFGYTEEKEFILKGLKLIQEKSLSEGIPAGAGGGPDYWTYDF